MYQEIKIKFSIGVSMLESIAVLIVLGLLLSLSLSAFRPLSGFNVIGNQARELARVEQAIQKFALIHHRLPCADTTGNGLEGEGGDCGQNTLHQVGAVPYVTLSLESGTAIGQGVNRNLLYGVYRNNVLGDSACNGQVANRTIKSRDLANHYKTRDEFRMAVTNAQCAGIDADRLFVTGNGFNTGNTDCNNRVGNMAYLLIANGETDADGNGSLFDSVHNSTRWPDGNNQHCFAPPSKKRSYSYDDLVIGKSFSELLGALTIN
ncbi:MAG: hypothetical protein RQ715_07015 [Methylococcales bacterium]|nr:hypothetical protein [Methylococcales bacterium]